MTERGPIVDLWQGETPEKWRSLWGVPALMIFSTISSTNDVAAGLAEAGAEAGTTVIANTQTSGRGQRGRQWDDTEGRSLLMSVVFRPESETVDPSPMPIRVGIATALAIEAMTGLRVTLKWPNDLILPGQGKLAGVLCETATGAGTPWLVAGIGVNVGQIPTDFHGLDAEATSLRMNGVDIGLADLAGTILRALSPFVVLPPPIDSLTLRQVQERDALSGRTISIDGRYAGTAAGIDTDGRLLVDSMGGMTRVVSGTVRVASENGAAPDENPDRALGEGRLQSETRP